MKSSFITLSLLTLLSACSGGTTTGDSKTDASSVQAALSSSPAIPLSSSLSSSSISSDSVNHSSSSDDDRETVPSVVYAINAGSAATATLNGIQYTPEGRLAPVQSGTKNGNHLVNDAIANTDADALYQSQRYGSFTYQLPVTQGSYNLTLHLSENYHSAVGMRIFSVLAEGNVVLNNADLFADYGGNFTAINISLADIDVNDGNLTLEFSAVADLAVVAGLLVTTMDGGPSQLPEPPDANGSGCKDAITCIDFESGIPSNISMPTSGGAKLTSDTAHSGSNALYFKALRTGTSDQFGYQGSYATLNTTIPGDHWGRLYYRIETFQNNAILHATLTALLNGNDQLRPIDFTHTNNAFSYMITNGNDSIGIEGDRILNFDNAWVCAEWQMSASNKMLGVYHNGAKQDLHKAWGSSGQTQTNVSLPSSYKGLKLGMQLFQSGTVSGWIDDVAIGTSRIGCE